MHDPQPVCLSQRAGDFDAEVCRLTDRQTFRMSLQEPPEILAVDQFRGYEHPCVGLIEVVDDGDTWMTQPSGRLGFPTKPSCVIWYISKSTHCSLRPATAAGTR